GEGEGSSPDASTPDASDAGTPASDGGAEVADASEPGDSGPFCTPRSPSSGLLPEVEGGSWKPLAPADEGSALVSSNWVLAVLADPSNDPVAAALDDGSFTAPASGSTLYGLSWLPAPQDADGALPAVGGRLSYVYAAASLDVPAPVNMVMRADNAYVVWINGRRQPGDLYASGKLRVPFRLEAGTNTIVLLGLGRRRFSIGMTSSSHEAVFNTLDATAPDLRVGERMEQWLGLPALVFGPDAALEATARVIENERFSGSAVRFPALAGGAVTQIPFLLKPKQPPAAGGETWTAEIQLDAPGWSHSYRATVDLRTAAADEPFRGTFLSPDDLSVQFYGVRPPSNFDPSQRYALVLSLHGASVDAFGQVGAYSSRDWNYVVAPTNRRPFGFDWEEWGHANAIFTLDEAMARFCTDPTRTYLTGHSMGGHGTWHVGTHNAGRFAMIGPSAGWNSFYSYTGAAEPTGPNKPARAHSKTTDFLGNLSHRAIYAIHGEADLSVPISESRNLIERASEYTQEIDHHWEPGAEHWWDGDQAPGVDCVDWVPLFEKMKERTLDPTELDFSFTSSAAWYSATYSYLTFTSSIDPYQLLAATSQSSSPSAVTLTTSNARSMVLDGQALRAKGVTRITVDGTLHELPDGPLALGPQTGKRPHVSGPFNQVFYRPFLFVYPDGASDYADYASYLVSNWALIGNGHAGALPASALTPSIAESFNLIHLGRDRADLPIASAMPFTWNETGVATADKQFPGASLLSVFDAGHRLGALLVAPRGKASLLYGIMPFSSRSGRPDYFVWDANGGKVSGYYSSEWTFDPGLGAGW
ncbi:MAG TPA: hypothetical protein DFS52_00545, partial [Myxococcales bacterium]|nr:hypothetical protein [Myxococcales bacterium]